GPRGAAPGWVGPVTPRPWATPPPLIAGSGLRLEYYPYFDATTGGVQFAQMMAALERLPPRAVVLLHASCHNPTGADLSQDEWRGARGGRERRRRRAVPAPGPPGPRPGAGEGAV